MAIKKPNHLIMKATMTAARVMRETLSCRRWGARGRVRLSTLRRLVTATNPRYSGSGVTTLPVTGSAHLRARTATPGAARGCGTASGRGPPGSSSSWPLSKKNIFRYQKTIEYFNAVHRVEMLARRDMLMGLMVTWARVESW